MFIKLTDTSSDRPTQVHANTEYIVAIWVDEGKTLVALNGGQMIQAAESVDEVLKQIYIV